MTNDRLLPTQAAGLRYDFTSMSSLLKDVRPTISRVSVVVPRQASTIHLRTEAAEVRVGFEYLNFTLPFLAFRLSFRYPGAFTYHTNCIISRTNKVCAISTPTPPHQSCKDETTAGTSPRKTCTLSAADKLCEHTLFCSDLQPTSTLYSTNRVPQLWLTVTKYRS
jgi:hypothetical protein